MSSLLYFLASNLLCSLPRRGQNYAGGAFHARRYKLKRPLENTCRYKEYGGDVLAPSSIDGRNHVA